MRLVLIPLSAAVAALAACNGSDPAEDRDTTVTDAGDGSVTDDGQGNGADDGSDIEPEVTWTTPTSEEMLALLRSDGANMQITGGGGETLGTVGEALRGVTLTPEDEIERLRDEATDVSFVTEGTTECIPVDDTDLTADCSLDINTYEIVPEGMECDDIECGESAMSLRVRLRQTGPEDWVIESDTATGFFAG